MERENTQRLDLCSGFLHISENSSEEIIMEPRKK